MESNQLVKFFEKINDVQTRQNIRVGYKNGICHQHSGTQRVPRLLWQNKKLRPEKAVGEPGTKNMLLRSFRWLFQTSLVEKSHKKIPLANVGESRSQEVDYSRWRRAYNLMGKCSDTPPWLFGAARGSCEWVSAGASRSPYPVGSCTQSGHSFADNHTKRCGARAPAARRCSPARLCVPGRDVFTTGV